MCFDFFSNQNIGRCTEIFKTQRVITVTWQFGITSKQIVMAKVLALGNFHRTPPPLISFTIVIIRQRISLVSCIFPCSPSGKTLHPMYLAD